MITFNSTFRRPDDMMTLQQQRSLPSLRAQPVEKKTEPRGENNTNLLAPTTREMVVKSLDHSGSSKKSLCQGADILIDLT